MKVFLISLFVATLAWASFANVIPSNETFVFDNSSVLETHNASSTKNATAFDMGETLTDILLSFKKAMPCGSPEYGIPPLSPLRVPSKHVNFTGAHLSLKGSIDDLVIDGLDDFLIIKLATNKTTNRTELDILYRRIQVLGKFNLNVEADLGGFKYVQPLKGYINFQVLNMRDAIGITIGQNEAGGVQISDYEYSTQIADIYVNSLNTEWSVAVNNFANQYIRDFSMLFFQTNREMIGKMYSEYLSSMANKSISKVPYDSMVSVLKEITHLLKSVHCHH